VRIVADSHALVFYLFTPARLSEPALEALLEAEDTDGIVVSAATLADLWYASQKTGSTAVAPGVFEQIYTTLVDPATNLVVHPISAATIAHFGIVPREQLRDPFDRLIVATAAQLRTALVTADRAISATGAVRVIW